MYTLRRRTLVCWNCRIVKKSEIYYGKCSSCGEDITSLPSRAKAPPKNKPKRWKKFKDKFRPKRKFYDFDLTLKWGRSRPIN